MSSGRECQEFFFFVLAFVNLVVTLKISRHFPSLQKVSKSLFFAKRKKICFVDPQKGDQLWSVVHLRGPFTQVAEKSAIDLQ